MSFIHDDFLLTTPQARELYHQYAAAQPIYDYHCHLSPRQIAENHQFADLAELWLAGDHYKWRAMRANGVSEKFITGDASPRDKFVAWAKTVPQTLRNPLYHWTHLELKRYFGIDELLNEKSADRIWSAANEKLKHLRVHDLFAHSKVAVVCTTDDPADSLEWHEKIQKSGLKTRVYPAFRPDKALAVGSPGHFNPWVDKLEKVSGKTVTDFDSFLVALHARHTAFHAIGGRLADHGLETALGDPCSIEEAREIFSNARKGIAATPQDAARYGGFVMLELGRWDAARGWTKQLHLGAIRNNNARGFKELGPDTGFDSIGDFPQVEALSAYMSKLAEQQALPKMILYNNNPNDNYTLASMTGNFQDGVTKGKIQFGSGWWFLDTKEGIEWQLNALSNIGLLSQFVGMLTDSRSFMSFPRHEYFRRVLCNLIGRDIENGEIPDDDDLVGPMIENICFGNARAYLGLEVPGAAKS